jgi:hypothetical protein
MNTPEAKLAAFQAKVKEDAQAMLAEAAKAAEAAEAKRLADEAEIRAKEAEAKKKEEEAKAAAKKAPALKELRDALADVRMVGSEGDAGIMKLAKVRVAVAMQAAKDAGCSQEEIVAASVPPTPAPDPAPSAAPEATADGARQDGSDNEKADEKPNFRVGDRVRGKDSGNEGVVVAVDDDGDPTVKLDGEEEEKPRYGSEFDIIERAPKVKKPRVKRLNRRKAMLMAVRIAALKASMAGEAPNGVAKAAAATAKSEGAEPADVAKAAGWGLKIADGETPAELDLNDPYETASGSSSSSSSTEEEDELAISEKDRAKANRDGIAAVFYFGVQNQLHYAPAQVPARS